MSPSPRMARRAIAGVALTCTAALAAGCGSASAPSATPTATVTVTASAPASNGASASPTATTPAAGGSPAGPPPCPSRYLQAKVGVSQGTAGSVYTVIVFTNVSNVTCTLYGYPGVSLAGGTPVTQIGLAAAESKATARTLVTLAPGATGNALLQIADAHNYPPSRCHLVTARYLQIYPPNQTTPIYLGYTSATCSNPVRILTVSVVQAGSGSSA